MKTKQGANYLVSISMQCKVSFEV